MFEKEYTFVVFVKDDNLIIQDKIEFLARGGKGGAFYNIRLDNISSVSTDEIPSKWLPALTESSTWNSPDAPKDVLKAFATSSRGSPIMAAYTRGVYINPRNHNRAFVFYSHRDKCITLTLKEPIVMSLLKDDFTQLAVKEVSFEVDDKEATARSITEALNGNVNALPRPIPNPKEVQKERRFGITVATIFSIAAILMILLVLYLIYSK